MLKCPECGGTEWIEQTTMGFFGTENPNYTTCVCGAKGRVRDWEVKTTPEEKANRAERTENRT